MTVTDSNPVDYKALRQRLAQFSCLETPPVLAETDKVAIREALRTFNEAADYETLGVCADTLAIAQTALESFVAALSRPVQLSLDARSGPVFLKFNTLKGAWYLDGYTGTSRGVLVSFHASEPEFDLVNGTYGPLPFDLFESPQ
ncbi:DUF1824 family protein [Leptolyngbya iicbica]|uniref:DUF1824 family protein n=2 Tax=Cyanophyceae TaxID=3028117 RepID=A0A4Q7EG28_9CYAN|nr:DUF1824 family protein [Leptolyngbya sp. LK]RZM82212.1 DUF1824 family protein [Leptolyngbya sp. LK]